MTISTQSDYLKQEINTLEVQLQHAQLFGDVRSQKRIFNQICEKKSILINIQ